MNKITRCGISLLIVISLLCACQATTAPSVSESALAASPVSSAESQVQAENAPITTEQLLEDYDFLWTALEENYVFFPILERQGIDVSSIQADTRAQIQNQEPDAAMFYETLRQMFLKCNHFAHLNVVSKDVYDSMAQYYCAEGREDSGWKDALEKENVRRFYENAPANASLSRLRPILRLRRPSAPNTMLSGRPSSLPSAPLLRKSSSRISSICRTFSSPMPRMR